MAHVKLPSSSIDLAISSTTYWPVNPVAPNTTRSYLEPSGIVLSDDMVPRWLSLCKITVFSCSCCFPQQQPVSIWTYRTRFGHRTDWTVPGTSLHVCGEKVQTVVFSKFLCIFYRKKYGLRGPLRRTDRGSKFCWHKVLSGMVRICRVEEPTTNKNCLHKPVIICFN